MRILYIHQHFATPGSATACRSYEFARRFVRRGHEVDMVTSDAMFPASIRRPRRAYCLDIEGINVHAMRLPYENRMGFVGRMRAFTSFVVRSCVLVHRLPRPDVVFATSAPLTVGIPGMYAAWLHHSPLVFEVRDLWPDVPIALGWLRNPLLKSLARRLERKIYRSSRRVVALSPHMADGVARTGYPPKRITVIPNCSDTRFFSSIRGDDAFRVRMGWSPQKVVVVHPGTMGQVNGLGGVLDAAPYLSRLAPETLVALVGDGREREGIEKRIARERLKNVAVHDSIPKTLMPRLLAASDIGLMTVLPLPALYGDSANKFFDFLAAGLPIVMNYGGWKAKLLRDNECGLVAEAGDPKSLAAAIARLSSDKRLRESMGRNARRLAEKQFSRDDLARQLTDLLEEVAPASKPIAGRMQQFSKRALDALVATVALALLSPAFLIIALLILLSMGRPVFYVGPRAGFGGRVFRLYKFRTMTDERGPNGELLPDSQRLTPLGRLVRALSLDELPQLLNILRGDMSLVGPRPLFAVYLDRYSPTQSRRHEVLPGITGWAQVNGRNAVTWEEKFHLDVWYVDHRSLWLDAKILFRTTAMVLRREGIWMREEMNELFMGSVQETTDNRN